MAAYARPFALLTLSVFLLGARLGSQLPAQSQAPPPGVNEVAVLAAEEHGASNGRDLLVLRGGIRSRDPQTARVAIRAVGRLERPELIADLIPALKSVVPEIRAEAANAIAQSAQGWAAHPPAKAPARSGLEAASAALGSQLVVETDPDVRAALAEAIGRLPYVSAEQIVKAEQTLLDYMGRMPLLADRLGVAQGLDALIRQRAPVEPPSGAVLDLLRALTTVPSQQPSESIQVQAPTGGALDPARAARVRRLAMEALIAAHALDADVVRHASADPDAQVRRLTMRGLAEAFAGPPELAVSSLMAGLADGASMVRLAALTAGRGRLPCSAIVAAERDADIHVAIAALDQLPACSDSPEAVMLLEQAAAEPAETEGPRRWHRRAHALVSLASADRSRASALLPDALHSRTWQIRAAAARAAIVLRDAAILEELAGDDDERVKQVAAAALAEVSGHSADPVGGPTGAPRRDPGPPAETETNGLTVAALRRLAATRARVTIAGLGSFDLTLIAGDAPLSALRFVRLAKAGYYDGLTLQVAPNLVMQGVGSPAGGALGRGSTFGSDEVGRWPHVRGAVGLSTRDGDVAASQFFVNLVDHPEFDHRYAVFGHVLNGMEVVDAVLDGDVIDKIDILDR